MTQWKRDLAFQMRRDRLVEAHVLRYWEDELGLAIPRNGQGHRYYREQDIHILHKIRDWKEQGFQLRAIKLLLPDRRRVEAMTPQELYHLREELNQKVQMRRDRSPKHARMGQADSRCRQQWKWRSRSQQHQQRTKVAADLSR